MKLADWVDLLTGKLNLNDTHSASEEPIPKIAVRGVQLSKEVGCGIATCYSLNFVIDLLKVCDLSGVGRLNCYVQLPIDTNFKSCNRTLLSS